MAPKKISRASLGIASAIMAAMCWGGALVMSKGALGSFYPVTLLIIQLMASVTFLWCVVAFRKISAPTASVLARLSLLGLLEPCLTYVLVLIGLTFTGASEASLLQSLESIMIVLLAMLLLKEIPSINFIVLSAMILVGLFFALDIHGGNVKEGWFGASLISLGMLSAAFYVVLSSRIAKEQDVFYIVACQQTLALVASILMLSLEWTIYPESKAFAALPGSLEVWGLALVSGVVQYALAFSFYIYSLKYIRAGLAGMFLNLVPVIGVVGAVVFLGERLSLLQVGGAALTIIALVLIAKNAASENTLKDYIKK